mgnify:CR=1 FL=1
MKVLHILASNKYSGAENVACQIIDMFKNEIEMAYCSPNGAIAETLNNKNIQYFPISKLSAKEIKRVIKEYKPDIIHCHDLKAIVTCANIKNIKKIAHIHVNHPKMTHLTLRSIVAKTFLKKYSHIYWVSDSCFKDFKYHNLFLEKSTILPNIISIKDTYKKIKDLNESYDYDIVYCGRLTIQKNPLRILEIVDLLKNTNKNIKVAICGDGDMLEQFNQTIKEKGLEKYLDVFGFVSNPFDIIYHSKLMILTSYFEGTPMTALESLALGTPIVSTSIDGMKKLIQNGVNGYLYETNDEAAATILRVLEDQKLFDSLKKNAKKFAIDINDVNEYKKKIIKAYRG